MTPVPRIIASLVVAGIGAGLYASPNFSAALGASPRQRRGVASGVFATARGLGMVIGFALGGAVFTMLLQGNDVTREPISTAHAASAAFVVAAVLAVLAGAATILSDDRFRAVPQVRQQHPPVRSEATRST